MGIDWKTHQHGAWDWQIALGQNLVGVELVLDRFDGTAGIDHSHAQVLQLAKDRQ